MISFHTEHGRVELFKTSTETIVREIHEETANTNKGVPPLRLKPINAPADANIRTAA